MHYDLGTAVGGFKKESGANFLVLRNNAMTSFASVIDACKKTQRSILKSSRIVPSLTNQEFLSFFHPPFTIRVVCSNRTEQNRDLTIIFHSDGLPKLNLKREK